MLMDGVDILPATKLLRGKLRDAEGVAEGGKRPTQTVYTHLWQAVLLTNAVYRLVQRVWMSEAYVLPRLTRTA